MPRTVFATETEHDKNLYALAYTAARCKLSSCVDECIRCDTYRRWKYCYDELAECDKLRVDNMAADLVARHDYARTLIKYKQKETINGNIRHYIRKVIWGLVVLFFLFFAGALLLMFVACSNSRPTGLSMDSKINAIVQSIPRDLRDINADNERDCIDRAIAFKLLWDNTYSDKCEIVRNLNSKYNLHHLYCRVFDSQNNVWILVEPDPSKRTYKVKDTWGSRYDPSCDIYGESYRWMKEVVYGKCNN